MSIKDEMVGKFSAIMDRYITELERVSAILNRRYANAINAVESGRLFYEMDRIGDRYGSMPRELAGVITRLQRRGDAVDWKAPPEDLATLQEAETLLYQLINYPVTQEENAWYESLARMAGNTICIHCMTVRANDLNGRTGPL